MDWDCGLSLMVCVLCWGGADGIVQQQKINLQVCRSAEDGPERPIPSWLFSMYMSVGIQLGSGRSELGLSQCHLGTSVCTDWNCMCSPKKHYPLGHGAPDGKEIRLCNLGTGWPGEGVGSRRA